MTKHSHPDLDTSTGLPRKAVVKAQRGSLVWLWGALQALVLACVIDIRNTGINNSKELGDLKVHVAKMEGLLKITASTDVPMVAVLPVEPLEVQ